MVITTGGSVLLVEEAVEVDDGLEEVDVDDALGVVVVVVVTGADEIVTEAELDVDRVVEEDEGEAVEPARGLEVRGLETEGVLEVTKARANKANDSTRWTNTH